MNYRLKLIFSRILLPSPTSPTAIMPGIVLTSRMRNFIRCAGISGALAICLGVYGAHVMKPDTSDELRRVKSINILFELHIYTHFTLVISISSNLSFASFSCFVSRSICFATNDYWCSISRWYLSILWTTVLSCYTR